MRSRIDTFPSLLPPETALSALRLDASVQSFSQCATNTASIASMMAGSFAYQVGKLASLQALSSTPFRLVSPFLASLTGLGLEVSAFQATDRLFHASSENFSEAWRRSFIDFGAMRSVGHLLRSSNIFVQHFTQDLAVIFGHQSGACLGFAPSPEGSFTDQMMEAEIMNLQLGAGNFLAARLNGHRLQRVEQRIAYRSQVSIQERGMSEVLLTRMAAKAKVHADLAEKNKGFRNRLGGIEQKLQHLDGEGISSASHNEHFAKLFTSFFELLDDATPGIEGIQNPALRRRLFECFHRFAGHEVSDPKLWVGNLTYALLTTYTHLRNFAGEEACRETIQFVMDHWGTPRLRLKVLKELQENRRFLNSQARDFLQEKVAETQTAFAAAEVERRNSIPPPGAPLIALTGLSSLLSGFTHSQDIPVIWCGLAFALIGGSAWVLRQSLQARRAREEFSSWVEKDLAAMHPETNLPEAMVDFEPHYRLLQVAGLAPEPLAPVFRDARRELSRAPGATLSEATRDSLVLAFMDQHPDSGESIAFIRESHALRHGDVALLEYTRAFDRYLLAYVLVDFIDALLIHRDIRLSPRANDRVWQWTNECYLQQMKDAEFLRAQMTVPSTPEPEPPPSQRRAAISSTTPPNVGTASPTTHLLELAHVDIAKKGALKGLADFLAALHENQSLRAHPDLPRAIKELTVSARIYVELHPGISNEARESIDKGLTLLLKVNGYSEIGEPLQNSIRASQSSSSLIPFAVGAAIGGAVSLLGRGAISAPMEVRAAEQMVQGAGASMHITNTAACFIFFATWTISLIYKSVINYRHGVAGFHRNKKSENADYDICELAISVRNAFPEEGTAREASRIDLDISSLRNTQEWNQLCHNLSLYPEYVPVKYDLKQGRVCTAANLAHLAEGADPIDLQYHLENIGNPPKIKARLSETSIRDIERRLRTADANARAGLRDLLAMPVFEVCEGYYHDVFAGAGLQATLSFGQFAAALGVLIAERAHPQNHFFGAAIAYVALKTFLNLSVVTRYRHNTSLFRSRVAAYFQGLGERRAEKHAQKEREGEQAASIRQAEEALFEVLSAQVHDAALRDRTALGLLRAYLATEFPSHSDFSVNLIDGELCSPSHPDAFHARVENRNGQLALSLDSYEAIEGALQALNEHAGTNYRLDDHPASIQKRSVLLGLLALGIFQENSGIVFSREYFSKAWKHQKMESLFRVTNPGFEILSADPTMVSLLFYTLATYCLPAGLLSIAKSQIKIGKKEKKNADDLLAARMGLVPAPQEWRMEVVEEERTEPRADEGDENLPAENPDRRGGTS